jgi:two-component system sensor histidine kinase BaeS
LRRRFAVYDAQGEPVIAPTEAWADSQSVTIVVNDVEVGTLRLRPLPKLESSWDLQFAREQLKYGLLSALAVLALATLGSMVFARRLSEPLKRMTDRARRIADGDYAARVEIARSDEIGELAQELDAMAAALERSRAARQRWTAEISHELRTPLSVIRAELDALEDGVRPLDQAAMRSLNGEAQRLSRLVEDLYQLALADAGALAYRFGDEDLSELLQEALDAHASSFANAGLTVTRELPPAAPVRADGERVRQMIGNLCANACRYTTAGGQVRVRLRDAGGDWRVDFEDSAPGVPPAALPQLFDPLFRVEVSRSREGGGAGLGLAIVRRIIEAHAARIRAEPSELGGLRIVIDWPKRAGNP